MASTSLCSRCAKRPGLALRDHQERPLALCEICLRQTILFRFEDAHDPYLDRFPAELILRGPTDAYVIRPEFRPLVPR